MADSIQCCDQVIVEPTTKIEFEDYGKEFKRMMDLARHELDVEFKKGRIKGAEYSAAVIEEIVPIMQIATKYVIDKLTAQVQAEEAAKTGVMTRKKIAQDISFVCMQESELSANGVSKRNVDISQVDLNYTQRAEAVANGITKREEEELNGESKRELESIQGTELQLNGTSKRALEAAQTSVAGAQEALYGEQENSFVKKAQNDAAKTISNMWTIFVSEVYGDIGSIPPIVASGDNMQNMLMDLGRAVDLQIPNADIPINPPGGGKKKIVKK